MMDFKVEWVYPYFLKDKPEQHLNELDTMRVKDVPVVRLAEVEKLIQEAEWAMELVFEQAPMFHEHTAKVMTDRSQAFLASVAAWRTGQEGK